jgi:hypothetical protein
VDTIIKNKRITNKLKKKLNYLTGFGVVVTGGK